MPDQPQPEPQPPLIQPAPWRINANKINPTTVLFEAQSVNGSFVLFMTPEEIKGLAEMLLSTASGLIIATGVPHAG